jgi:hypothetical protein
MVSAYHEVHDVWERLSRDAHIGLSDAFRLAHAAANSDEGRLALTEILGNGDKASIIDGDALSYLRISRDLPLPPGVENQRADQYFRTRFYTGTRLSESHRVANPNEFLYFNFTIAMITGTLEEPSQARNWMRESGYVPVTVRSRGGAGQAIGIIMVNEFRDTTFGPYNEVILMATAVREDAPDHLKAVEYVNPYSLQTPLDRGATTFVFKLWLNELGPIDGGNDYLGTNKDLGCFRFEDKPDGTRQFRSWDKDLRAVVSGTIPRSLAPDRARAVVDAYRAAAAHAGSRVPTGTVATIPVASRPDNGLDKPASTWAFAVDWRQCFLQDITPRQVDLRFGENDWAKSFERLRFTPALSFFCPSGVGQILKSIGDSPYDSGEPVASTPA